MKLIRALGLAGVMFLLAWKMATAQQVWPKLTVTELPGTYDFPTHITHAGDGSGRLFIVERNGVIKIIQGNQVLATPFLDIRDRVGGEYEGGLLSIAFAPDFATSGSFYVYYSSRENLVPPDGSVPDELDGDQDTVVSRFRITADPDVADPTGEEPILVVNHPRPFHYGGQLAFGPHGYLYISIGDSGFDINGVGDPQQAAQQTDSLLGKLLRIDVSTSLTYTVPISNPFYDTVGYRPEIWAIGFRNPWRFSFDRLTDDLFIADVGHLRYEEINFQPWDSPGGENYGWNVLEGNHCYNADTCDPSGFVPPVVEYPHDESGNCSVIGGHVYRGTNYPTMAGVYFYGDFCTGRIWGLRRTGEQWETQELAPRTDLAITTFGEDEAGNLYVPFFRETGEYSQLGLYRIEAIPVATVAITKVVVGQAPESSWQFTGSDDIGAFDLPAAGGGITFTVAAGTYTVTEESRSDYHTAVTCTNGASANGTTIVISVTGEIDIGCTFTNTKITDAFVTITKTVVGPSPGSDWRFTGSGGIDDFSLPAIGGSATFTVPAGVYTVTEEIQGDYTPKLACTNGASASSATITFTLPVGAHLGCTFTNTYNLGAVAGRIYISNDGNDQPGTGDGVVDATVALYSTAAITPSETMSAVRAASFLTTTDPVTTTSQVDGSYILTNVPAGMYTMTVTLPAGFAPLDSQIIEVVGGMTTTVDFIATPLPVYKEFYLPLLPNR